MEQKILITGAGGGFGGKVRGGFEIAVAGVLLHLVRAKNVLSTSDKVFFLQAQVGITGRLVKCHYMNPLSRFVKIDRLRG